MKLISLTKGYVALVDDEDYDYLMQWKWHVAISKTHNIYAKRTSARVNGKQKTIKMHREILSVPEGLDVDHIDGNGLNNIRANIRICTQSENTLNSRKHKQGNSIYRGITKDKTRQGKPRWRYEIRVNGTKRKRTFKTEMEAVLARDRYIIDNNIVFATLNVLSR